MKIKYIRIDDQSVVFEENKKLFILDIEGNKTETSEHFIHSQFWNGPSPFVQVDIQADSFIDACKKDGNVLNMFFEYNLLIIKDMVDIGFNHTNLIDRAEESCVEIIEEIFSVIKIIKG